MTMAIQSQQQYINSKTTINAEKAVIGIKLSFLGPLGEDLRDRIAAINQAVVVDVVVIVSRQVVGGVKG